MPELRERRKPDYLTKEILRKILGELGIQVSPGLNRPQLKGLVKQALGGKCAQCGEERPTFLQIDHIKPASEGGTHETVNLRVLCGSCHQKAHRYHRTWNRGGRPKGNTGGEREKIPEREDR